MPLRLLIVVSLCCTPLFVGCRLLPLASPPLPSHTPLPPFIFVLSCCRIVLPDASASWSSCIHAIPILSSWSLGFSLVGCCVGYNGRQSPLIIDILELLNFCWLLLARHLAPTPLIEPSPLPLTSSCHSPHMWLVGWYDTLHHCHRCQCCCRCCFSFSHSMQSCSLLTLNTKLWREANYRAQIGKFMEGTNSDRNKMWREWYYVVKNWKKIKFRTQRVKNRKNYLNFAESRQNSQPSAGATWSFAVAASWVFLDFLAVPASLMAA